MVKIHHILVTRPLNDDQINYSESLNLSVTIKPAIQIKFREEWDEISTLVSTVQKPIYAFTSQSGVKAFERFQKQYQKFSANQTAYALGSKTAKKLIKIGFIPITPDRQDGIGLAEKLIADFTLNPDLSGSTILHFCGNKRRDEFRQYLENSGIQVRDVVVYKTILKRMTLGQLHYNGILFYSPSAVHAFRNSGGFMKSDLPELFAIGKTTGRELSIESGKHVHISPKPDTKTFLTFVHQILSEKPDETRQYE